MTFPSIAARNQGAASANVTTTALPLPASIAAGNLLCAWIAIDGTVLPTWGTGLAGWNVLFTALDTGTTSIVGMFLYRIATGTESGNIGITTPSEAWAGHTWRITSFDPNTPPDFATAGDGGTGTTNPNPPSLNPAAWGTEDTLWLALGAGDGNVAFTAAPTNYTTNANFQLSTNATTTDRVASGQGDRALNGASDDPGTFTRALEDWLAATVGIRGSQTATLQTILRNATFYSASGTTPTNAFTLDAGSNRRIMVSVAHETAGVTVSSMTYGGQSMALVTDGTDSAASTNTARVEWWTLREANLPSNGSQNLVVTLSATAEVAINIMTVAGTSQDTNVRDVVNANTAGATTVTTNVSVGHVQDMVLSCCNGNNNVAFTNYTVNALRAMGRGSCNLPTGGAFVMNIAKVPAATGTLAVTSTLAASTRQVMSSVVLAPFPADVTGAVTTSSASVTGVPEQPAVGGPDPAFVTSDSGTVPRSVVIDASTNLLVVVTTNSAAHTTARTVTYNGVALDVATFSNDFAQVHYMFDPPVGSHTLDITPTSNLSGAGTLQFANMDSFASAQEASLASDTFSPSRRAAIAMGISATSTSHTPVAGTNETLDSGGNWVGYRVVTSGGSVTVGVASATDPDYAGAIFLGTNPAAGNDIDGALTTSAASVSASLQSAVNVTAAVTTSSASVTGSLQTPKNLSGAVTTSAASSSGSLETPKSLAAAVTTSSAAASGSVETPKNVTGSTTTSSASVTGSLQSAVNVTGATTTSSASVTGSLENPRNLSGAVTTSSATSTGNVETPKNVTAAVTTASASSTGSLETPKSITGAVTTSAASVTGSLETPQNVTAALTTSSAAVNGTISVTDEVLIGGAVTTSSPAVAGELVNPSNLSGAVTTTGPSTTGSLQTPLSTTAALTTSSAAVTGSLSIENTITAALTTSGAAVAGSLETSEVEGITAALTTSGAAVTGSLENPRNLSAALGVVSAAAVGSLEQERSVNGALTTSPAAVLGSLLAVPPAGIPGTAVLEVVAGRTVIIISVGQTEISLTSARAAIGIN